MTHDEWVERLKDKYGDKYAVLSQYVNSVTTVKVRCNKCGLVFSRQASKLMYRGYKCRGCAAKGRLKSHDKYRKQIKVKYGSEITLLSEYISEKNKIFVRHNTCGAEYWTNAGNLLRAGVCCKNCQGERNRRKFVKTQEEFIADLTERRGSEYDVLGQYINAQTKILVKHNVCGYEWGVRPITLLLRGPCPICGRAKLKCKDPIARKVVRGIRSRIIHVLQGRTKSKPTLRLLGVNSKEEFKIYLESKFDKGMNWDNYGTAWHVDHIRPVASFNLSDPTEQGKCFHHTNLQPLWAEENMVKSSWFKGQRYREGEVIGNKTLETV